MENEEWRKQLTKKTETPLPQMVVEELAPHLNSAQNAGRIGILVSLLTGQVAILVRYVMLLRTLLGPDAESPLVTPKTVERMLLQYSTTERLLRITQDQMKTLMFILLASPLITSEIAHFVDVLVEADKLVDDVLS